MEEHATEEHRELEGNTEPVNEAEVEFIKPAALEFPPVPYSKPEWSGKGNKDCFFDVLKGGIQIETLGLKEKSYSVIGRIPVCQISLEHPSISRYHAVIQFNSKGKAFIFDLGSSHGTFLNKLRIEGRKYYPMKFGDQLRFGDSTRLYIFNEPQEPEREEPVQAIQNMNIRIESEEQEYSEEQDEENFYTLDPKKALFIFMENRGFEIKYEVEEEGPGCSKFFNARVRIPIYLDETDPSRCLTGQGSSSKKREAERLAALDACAKLDKAGILRGNSDAEAELRNKRMKMLLDGYESDDNLFYDPAGEAEKDRRNKKKQKRGSGKVETYATLKVQTEQLHEKMSDIKEKLLALDNQEALDANDEFAELMGSLKKDQVEKEKKALESSHSKLTLELKKINKLIEIIAPNHVISVPKLAQNIPDTKATSIPVVKQQLKSMSPEPAPQHEVPSCVNNSSDRHEDIEEEEIEEEVEEEEPEENWVPPEGQTGDGRTFLNEKYGY